MKKLLYIVADSKPETLSSCKTVGRALVSKLIDRYDDLSLEEVDLYNDRIPRPKYSYYNGRSSVADSNAISQLSPDEQDEVRRMISLCDQFVSASVYVVAAPMWSLSFPAPLKDYIDCVIQANKTIVFKGSKPEGLLNDRPRTFIYVQSSGADIPWLAKPILNKGLNYVKEIMSFIGIKKFEEILADGTGTTEEEKSNAIEKAESQIGEIAERIQF